MKIAEFTYRHRRSILFLIATICIAGLYSAWRLPAALFPRITFPRVVVSLEAGDRPAERMVVEVTQPVEEAVRSVPGVQRVRSVTSRGGADVSINFDWGQDMVAATLQIESAINLIRKGLPTETQFNVRLMDPTVFPVLGFSLTSDTRSLVELRDIVLYQVRPLLSTVAGIARIDVVGGDTAEYQVIVSPEKLDSFGLTIADVARSLSASNIDSAVGRVEDMQKLYLVLTDTRFLNIDEISRAVVHLGENGLILLEDLATVNTAVEPRWTRVTADGHNAVLFQIHQQPGGNTVQIKRQIEPMLDELRQRLPKDVHIANWYDQSELIVSSVDGVRDAVIIGIVLAAMVTLVFLRNLRVTLVAMVTVPLVLAATLLFLNLLGQNLNVMTLGGMAAAVGLIIDDAIVMVEHIMRRLQSAVGDAHQTVSIAASEMTRPLLGSSISTVIVFSPLAFLSGVAGAFFKALSLTMAVSLAVSCIVAWLIVPVLAIVVFNQEDAKEVEGGRFTSALHAVYTSFMRFVLRNTWIVFALILPLLFLGWVCYQNTGSGFLPTMDEGGFILDYRAAPGTSLSETDRMLRELEAILRATPEVQTYSRRTGLQLGGGLTEANEGDFFVRLRPRPRREIEAVVEDVRAQIDHSIPGLQIELLQLMEDLIGDLTEVPQPIEIKLFSNDGDQLRTLAPNIADAIEKVPGVVDVNNGVVLAGDALVINVDRDKAALERMAADSVTQILQGYLAGVVTTQVQVGPKMVGVRVWIPQTFRSTAKKIESLRITAPDGHRFPLKRVARVEAVVGQQQITRDNLKQMVAVTGRISGRDLGSTIDDITKILTQPGVIPDKVYYQLGGLYEQQQLAFRDLIVVFISAVLLVFVLLLYLYESIRVAIATMLTTLLGVSAVFIGLWLTGTELNISAMMGMTMIVGIVTEVEIFYNSELYDLSADLPRDVRLTRAGVNRMRPITMTTIAAILALLPLVLGVDQGAALQRPLAVAIISGLLIQVPLVLIVLPAFLQLLGAGRMRPVTRQASVS